MRVHYEGAFCSFHIYKGVASVYSLGTDPKHRRKGHAKKLLRILRKCADRHAVCIELTASAYSYTYEDSEILDQCKLILFYMKNGFELIEGRSGGYASMRYTPKVKNKGV